MHIPTQKHHRPIKSPHILSHTHTHTHFPNDESTPRLIAWANVKALSMAHMHLNAKPNQRPNNKRYVKALN